MTDRTFGIEITADHKVAVTALREVSDEIDQVGAAGKRLNDSNVATTQAQVNAAYAAQKAAEQYRAQAESLGSASVQVQKLLDRYDPLGTKLRSLQSDFALLNKAAMGGELGSGTDAAVDKTYAALNTEIAKTKDLMAAAGAATQGSAGSMVNLGLNTQMARRELMQLGREAMSGDFSRMPVTLGSLVGHSQILPALLNPVGLAIIAIAGTVGVLTYAIVAGRKEMEAMNNALASTNDFAGMTRGGMVALAESISQTSKLTVGSAKDMVTQIVASGWYSGENVSLMSSLVKKYASITGESVDKVTPKIIQMFEDPLAASLKLTDQYHYLTVAEYDHIKALQDAGQMQEAATAAMRAFNDGVPDAQRKLEGLALWWNNVKQNISGYVDALKTATAGPGNLPIEQQLQKKGEQIATYQQLGIPTGELEQQFNALTNIYVAQQKLNAATADEAKARDAALKTHLEVQKILGTELGTLQQQLAALQKKPQILETVNAEAVLRKKISDIITQQGAEGRAVAAQAIDDATKLWEIQKTSSADAANAQLSLGNITKADHDAWLTWLDVQDLKRKQSDDQEKLAIGGLSAQQTKALQDQIALYGEMVTARQAKGDNQQQIDDLKTLNDLLGAQTKMFDDLQKKNEALATTENKRLDDALAKQRLVNAEIGKTPAQKDLERAADDRLKVAAMEREAEALRADAAMDDTDQRARDIMLARANALDLIIGKEKALADAVTTGAAQQAAADATKKQTDEWNKLWTSIEQVGKQAFVHVLADGKNAFQAIGTAIKTSVIDLLYEITAKQWIISLKPELMTAFGISTAADAAGGAGAVPNGVGLLGNLGFGSGAASGLYGQFATSSMGMGLGLSTVTDYGGMMMTGLGTAIPYVGAAIAIASALGLFSGGGGPKNPTLGISTSGIGAAPGLLGVSQNDFGAGSMTAADAQTINTWLQQLPDTLKKAIDGFTVQLDPGSTAAQAWAQLQAQINSTAASLNLSADDMKHLQDVATQAAAAAALEAQNVQLRQSWQDKLDVATGAKTQLQIDRTNELASTTDAATLALMKQTFAAEDLATATAAATKAHQDFIDSVTAAQAVLQKSVDAERAAVNAAYDAATAAVNTQLTSVNDSISRLTSLSQSLHSALNAMGSGQTLGIDRASAQAQISAAVAIYKASGVLPDSGSLQNALSVVAKPSEALFSTFREYMTDFARTQADIGTLAGATDAQLTDAQQTVVTLNNQLGALKKQNDLDNAFYDKILTDAQSQLDALNGINTSVLSVADALDAFTQSLTGKPSGATKQPPPSGAVPGPTPGPGDAVLGPFDVSQVPVIGPLATGTDYIPRTGWMLGHQGERVTPAEYNRSDATNAALLEELKAQSAELRTVRQEISAMKASSTVAATYTKKTSDLLQRATRDGNSLVTTPA